MDIKPFNQHNCVREESLYCTCNNPETKRVLMQRESFLICTRCKKEVKPKEDKALCGEYPIGGSSGTLSKL